MFYSCVRLNSNELLIVRTSWCEGMHSTCTKRYGRRPTRQCKIFFSADANEKPDFTMAVKEIFDAEKACYIGRVLNTFSKSYTI